MGNIFLAVKVIMAAKPVQQARV